MIIWFNYKCNKGVARFGKPAARDHFSHPHNLTLISQPNPQNIEKRVHDCGLRRVLRDSVRP